MFQGQCQGHWKKNSIPHKSGGWQNNWTWLPLNIFKLKVLNPLYKNLIFPWPVSHECYHRSLAVSHECYRRSLAVSSTTSVYVGILGVCLRFKPHWMFQIYLRVMTKLAQLPVSVARCIATSWESHIWDSEVYRTPTWWLLVATREFGTQWHHINENKHCFQALSDWPVLRDSSCNN